MLSVCALLILGVGVSSAQFTSYTQCKHAYPGCYPMGPDDCFVNSGICQDHITGVYKEFDGFNNLAVFVGHCENGEGDCDDQTKIKVCSTSYFKRDLFETCGTPACYGEAFSKACPNPQ